MKRERKWLIPNEEMNEKRPKEYYQEVFKYVVREFNKNQKKTDFL